MIRALILALLIASGARAETTVLAAASTSGAVAAAIAASGVEAVTSFGASGTLARQIEQGAPADLFISANPKWMDYLVDAGLVEADSVQVLMSNSLVLIAPEGSGPVTPEALAGRIDGENFVMADPESAPVGAYGKAALETLGLWEAVAPAFVPMRNTLAAVAAVQSGEAALRLVYASDVIGRDGIEVAWPIPGDSHPPIRYLVAPVAGGEGADGAETLCAYLQSDAGRAILAGYGFLPVAGGA